MAEEGKNRVDDLAKLLDETLSDFEKRKVTDDELDDIMQEYDRTAVEKTARDFDAMLSKLSEDLESKQPGAGTSEDRSDLNPEMMDMFSTMRDSFMAQDMSPMIRATAAKYDAYLAEKGDQFSAEEKANFEKQRDQLVVIAEEYAKPEPEAGEMNTRLENIKAMWTDLQQLGEPPADLFPIESMNSDCTII